MMPSSLQDSIYLMEEEPVVFICLVWRVSKSIGRIDSEFMLDQKSSYVGVIDIYKRSRVAEL